MSEGDQHFPTASVVSLTAKPLLMVLSVDLVDLLDNFFPEHLLVQGDGKSTASHSVKPRAGEGSTRNYYSSCQ
jgi:hypothetical protein